MRHILFVYNPVAGVGKVKKKFYEIIDFFDRNDCLVTLCPIRRLNDFYSLLGFEKENYDFIVCSGGDGTLNIMISFLREKGIEIPVGYIPTGSTNDYAYSLGIAKNFNTALENVLQENKCKTDIGKFNDKYFVYVAAFGIFTKATYSTPQKVKNLLGYTAYILEGIKQISELKSCRMSIKTDDVSIEDTFILGLIANTFSVGGFKNIMPNDVSLDDGKFEMILIKEPKNLLDLRGIVVSLLGEDPGDNPYIIYSKTSHVEIVSEETTDWTLDGEYGGNDSKIEIINLQKELTMLV